MTRGHHSITATLSAIGLTLTATACGGQSPEEAAQEHKDRVTSAASTLNQDIAIAARGDSSSSASRPNPVSILKKVKGCRFEQGVELGETDLAGERYAECDVGEGNETVVVFLKTDPDPANTAPESDDSHVSIIGSSWFAKVSAKYAGTTLKATGVNVSKIASQLGGKVKGGLPAPITTKESPAPIAKKTVSGKTKKADEPFDTECDRYEEGSVAWVQCSKAMIHDDALKEKGITKQEQQLFSQQGGAGSPEDRRQELRNQGWKQNSRGEWYKPSAEKRRTEEPRWDSDYDQAASDVKRMTKSQKAKEKKFCEENSAYWHPELGCIAD